MNNTIATRTLRSNDSTSKDTNNSRANVLDCRDEIIKNITSRFAIGSYSALSFRYLNLFARAPQLVIKYSLQTIERERANALD